MPYSTQLSVLKEAGLWHREIGATPAGLANGSNTVFTVDKNPLADTNDDDSLTTADVTAYVDGTSVAVTSLNGTTGAITLTAAPGNGTDVTIDYAYSSVATDEVADVIEEADEWIDDELNEVLDATAITASKRVRMLSRLYAGALLMIRYYGLENNDEQLNSGEAKLKLAIKLMGEYRDRLIANGEDTGTIAVPAVSTPQRLFQKRNTEEGRWDPLADENFTVNRES